jgi:predicted dehydrogenase
MSQKPVSVMIVGAGNRGTAYSMFAELHPERMKVVAVAEPRAFYRQQMASKHAISAENVFSSWEDAADRARLADAVIITTQDSIHAEPAVAFASQGYAMLCEKPMANNPEDCHRIVQAAQDKRILFAVCHVLRYTAYTTALKKLVDSGIIGEMVSIQHLEPVGYWHMAHSYVRGNWRSEKESSFMLLAKSVHDLDWIRYILGAECRSVSSFGSLQHFRHENMPVGASERCLDCKVEANCPYSARRIYLGMLSRGQTGWPVSVVQPDPTMENLTEALRTGPYGRCVYACDNDVVDNQVVNLEFAGGKTATFSMIGTSHKGNRKTRIFGTRGELSGDGTIIEHLDFLTDVTRQIDTRVGAVSNAMTGHSGGDYGLVDNFIQAVSQNAPGLILSGPDVSLETHLMTFAAEQSRREHRTIDL